jgi:PAS domain S-box-containing protein
MPRVDAPQVPTDLILFCERSKLALALASPSDDIPLLYVNPGFCDLTGYLPSDLIGRNCRVLQGRAKNEDGRAEIKKFLQDSNQFSLRTILINFKKDGTPFVNLLYLSRLLAPGGGAMFYFASQFDVSQTHPDQLLSYNALLGAALSQLGPLAKRFDISMESTLTVLANSAAAVAQARLTLEVLPLRRWAP